MSTTSDDDHRARFIGGPADRIVLGLERIPPYVDIAGHRYRRVDDPDTGEWLGGYAATFEDLEQAIERGRELASQREDLIVAGVDPAELAIPIAPPPKARPMLPDATRTVTGHVACNAPGPAGGYCGRLVKPGRRHRGRHRIEWDAER